MIPPGHWLGWARYARKALLAVGGGLACVVGAPELLPGSWQPWARIGGVFLTGAGVFASPQNARRPRRRRSVAG